MWPRFDDDLSQAEWALALSGVTSGEVIAELLPYWEESRQWPARAAPAHPARGS
jgi:hypothetical protein